MKTRNAVFAALAAGIALLAGPVPSQAGVETVQDHTSTMRMADQPDRSDDFEAAPNATKGGYVRDYCIGTKINGKDLRSGTGKLVGRIELWYSPTGPGGENCVMTYNYLPGDVRIEAGLGVKDAPGKERDSYDWGAMGEYQYYAGGAYRNYVNGKCVRFYGQVIGDSYANSARYFSSFGNCG